MNEYILQISKLMHNFIRFLGVILCLGALCCSKKNKKTGDIKTDIKAEVKDDDKSKICDFNNRISKRTTYCKRQYEYTKAMEYFAKKTKDESRPQPNNEPAIMPINPSDIDILKNCPQDIAKALNQKIDLNISDEMPVKDLLFDIASTYDIDIQLKSNIDEQIAISVSNKKIIDIFKIISRNTNLRFSIDDSSITFEKDDPYIKNYIMTLLDTSKTGNDFYGAGSSFSSANNGGAGATQTGTSQASNVGSGSGSSSQVSNVTEWSVWKSFEDGLLKILETHKSSTYNLNKQAGIVTINTTLRGHREVAEYIAQMKKYAMMQIMVELRLVELTLDDDYRSGVKFSSKNPNGMKDSSTTSIPFGINSLSSGFFSAGFSKGGDTNLDAAINLFQKFGITKVVSSPRINVVNNQKAVLSFAQDKIYFEIKPTLQNQFATVGQVANPTTPIVVNSTVKSIPVGIILSLQAVANPDTNEVTLNVRPSLSSTNSADDVEDPAALFLNSYSTSSSKVNISNKVPVVKKKELDSVMKIQSGGVMVLGGFNEETSEVTETGVPWLMNIPFFGNFFKSNVKTTKNIETIIFVKATIIPSGSIEPISKTDKDFYLAF